MEIDELSVETQNELFRELAETTPTVLWIFTADWETLIFVNDRYETFWGRDIDDLERNPADFLEGIHPDDRQAVQQTMRKVSNGEPAEIEYRVNRDEDYGRWVHVHGKPIRDKSGDVVRVAGFVSDITDEKRREQELERKNERLESFASVVSHDLRNPLTVAKGNLELAKDDCESEHLAAVERSLDRMDGLIESLLELASGQSINPRPVELEHIATTSWDIVATDSASLDVESDAVIRADSQYLKQLFENLYRNAVLHGGPEVRVSVTDLEDGNGFAVADDGPGIPENNREAVFESGYSTIEDSTGLGLAIVDDIADSHGWAVTITESEHGGARFEFEDVDRVT